MKQSLYDVAMKGINYKQIGKRGEKGHVSCALETKAGNVYTGVSIDLPCSIGFCAEHSAIASMINKDETHIKEIVAVYKDGTVFSPCGRCREMISQIDINNYDTDIWIDNNKKSEIK